MSTANDICIEIEPNRRIDGGEFHRQRRRRRRSPSVACSSRASFNFPDTCSDQLPVDLMDGPHDKHKFSREPKGVFVTSRGQQRFHPPLASDSEDEEVDQESGYLELNVFNKREERTCRICHLNLEENADGDPSDGFGIQLGCECKGDLGAAHVHCAVTWFHIKGNIICEICGATATALNAMVEQEDVVTDVANVGEASYEVSECFLETQNVNCGRLVLAAVGALLVSAFVVSYLLHMRHDD